MATPRLVAVFDLEPDLVQYATPAELARLRVLLGVLSSDWQGTVARPEQLVPLNHRRTCVLGGRGAGKTRTGAETLAEWAWTGPPGEWAVMAPNYGHARDVCIEGPRSGLLRVLGGVGGPKVRAWNTSLGHLHLRNGATIYVDGADDGAPDIQGKNLSGAWCDEIGLWSIHKWEMAWRQSLGFGLRLDEGRVVVTGTPKRGHPLVKLLVHDPAWVKVVMRTRDNVDNLSEDLVGELERVYGGTTMGRQELEGEYLEDIDGALWTLSMIDAARLAPGRIRDLQRIVVGVDPAASATGDETGIVVCAQGPDGDGYVLADVSCRLSPDGWGRRVVEAYHEWSADRVIAEANQGGEMVRHVLHTVDPGLPVTLVHASRGKRTRAEPIAAMYEQGRVHHVGAFAALEDQLCSFTAESGASPDRLDAMVWALTDLLISNQGASIRIM